jgi:hypothetical protein
MWADADGNLHVSVPELLEVFGWPDDAEHREQVKETVRAVLARQYPGLPIIETD